MKQAWIVSAAVIFLMTGCENSSMSDQLEDIKKLSAANTEQTTQIESIRYDMLRETALAYSSQKAFAHYTQKVHQALQTQEKALDNAFNFQPLILKNQIVPPVIEQSDRQLQQTTDKIITIADRSYSILKQAYFQTTPLTWRDYLYSEVHMVSLPDKSLLPQNPLEQTVWADFSEIGWQAGKQQAYMTVEENLKQLVREYRGMVHYHRLLVQGIVTSPQVTEYNHGITSDSDRLNINQRTLSIDVPTHFNESAELWHSFVFFHDE